MVLYINNSSFKSNLYKSVKVINSYIVICFSLMIEVLIVASKVIFRVRLGLSWHMHLFAQSNTICRIHQITGIYIVL